MKLHETVGPEVLESQSLLPSTAAAEVTQSRTEEGDVEEQEEEDEEKVIIERKSPKHTKIDCRIPRMSAGGQSQQRPTRSQGIIPKSQQQQQQMDDITNENKSDCREASPHGSLSPSRKSEHSSHNGGSNSKIITTSTTSTGSASSVKSSSFSGIPRMSSPRPTQHHHQRSSSQQAPSSKDRRNSPRNITSHDGGQVNSNSGNSSSSSRLPVFRKNVMSKSSPNSSSPNRRSSSNSQGRSGGSNSATKISSPSSISKTPSPSVSNRSSASPVATITSFSSSSSTESKSSKNVPATTTGKDEGYSTMSSEALAEQEKRDTGPILMMTKGRGSSSSNNGTGKLMHKSNTFNTFREMGDNNYWLATNSSNGGGGKGVRAVGRLVEPRNFTSLPPAAKAIVMASSTLATTVTTAANTPSPAGTPLKKGTVRIIRGMPYEIEHIGGEDNEPSASTILWEDSDDSDILFLPLEMSSGSSSRSTLIPPPSSHSEGNFLTSSSNNKVTAAVRPIGGGANPVGFLTEDRALIEKWMRLEDVRNEVQWDDEWAWDWDGVQQAPGGVSSNIPLKSLRSIREAEADDDNEDGGNDDDDEFWLREKDLFLQTFPQSSLLTSHGEDGRLVEKAGEVVGVGGVGESDGSPAQIDSSTWTKTKCGKIKSKLLEDAGLCGDEFGIAKGGRSSNVASRGAAASEGEVENSQQQQRQPKQQLYVMGNGIVGKKIATTTSPHSFSSPSSSNTTTSPLKRTQNELRNEQQEGLLINEQCQSSSETMKNTTVATEPASLGEDGIPPVIEFTPEYYHLVNYGSNLSFSDNESSSSPQHSHEIRSSLGPNNNNNSSKCSRNAASSNNSKSSSKSSYNHQHHNSRMDDKVSQTDFEGESSQENISTSAELFSECRNCLEMIKKLVSSPSSEDPSCSATAAAILVQSNGRDGAAADFSSSDEQRTDAGCPTTWISVPKGLPTTEVGNHTHTVSSILMYTFCASLLGNSGALFSLKQSLPFLSLSLSSAFFMLSHAHYPVFNVCLFSPFPLILTTSPPIPMSTSFILYASKKTRVCSINLSMHFFITYSINSRSD